MQVRPSSRPLQELRRTKIDTEALTRLRHRSDFGAVLFFDTLNCAIFAPQAGPLPAPCNTDLIPMELPKTYNPAEAESKWYAFWLEQGFFKSTPDEREPYTVVIPPPNVTGVLHMGHMLNNTIQDVLVRRARMQGKNA